MKTLHAKNTDEGCCIIYIPSLSFLEGIENEQMNEFVRDSIDKEGLIEPLAVWRCTKEQWEEYAKDKIGIKKSPEGADRQLYYMVRTGNNRLRGAMALGYDAISCRVFEDVEEAIDWSRSSRKRSMYWREPYKRKFK